jgi:carboxypeptidase family protein
MEETPMLRKVFVLTLSLVLGLGSLTGLGLATAMAATAQATTGRLVGTVSGPDGVIAGATVVVRDNQTGKEQTITTNSEGSFEVAQLEFGTYSVKVTANGFKTYTATDLVINVGKEYSLAVPLEIGAITETVNVSAGAEVINSTNAELSNSVGKQQIQELPLNGRNPLGLVSLQAGTSNASGVTTINGQRTSFTNITRDGINVQDNFIRSNATDFTPDRPNVDDVSEFTIVTQNAGAELGYGSAQVQLVTPRGANTFHGAGYIYNRNSEFGANSYFNNAAKVVRPFLNRNQFGGSISGPIIKDKVFFFGAYEGFRLHQSANQLATILVPQARNGTFTYLDNSGAHRSVNVLSLTGLPADQLVASRILSQLPTAGNSTNAGDQLNTTGFQFVKTSNQNRDAWTSRFDWEVNQNNSVSVVYNYKKEFLQRPDIDNGGFGVTPIGNQDANTPFLSVAYRTSPSARWSNEARGGFQFSDPKFDRTGHPDDFFIGVPLITSPESTFEKQGRNTKIINFQDNVVWARDKHSFRFGGQAQIFRVVPYGPPAFANSTIPTWNLTTNTATPALAAGQFPGGISTAQLGNANSLLALLAGLVGNGNLTFVAKDKNSGLVPGLLPIHGLNYENYSGYFSDQWRVTPELTLNLGVRYELFTGIREPNGLALEPGISPVSDIISTVLDPNGRYQFVGGNVGGTKFFNADKNNFAPVLSAAWSPSFKNGWMKALFPGEGRTVFRGGYRESYVNDEFVRAADNALSGNAGLTTQVSAINPANGTATLNSRFSSLPGFVTPAFQVPRTYTLNNLLAGRFGTVFGIDPDLAVPRFREWNFGIQRDIGFNTTIEVRYVGSKVNNLVRGKDFNQVDIFNNGFLADFNRARANMVLTGGASGNPGCTSAGCQTLTVFPNLGGGGLLTNSTIRSLIFGGTPADLAITYVTNNLSGTVKFLPNPNTGVADVLLNDARSNYNSLQMEVRRRFSHGLYFQFNYTYSKVLADAPGTGQTRFDPPLSIFAPEIEYSRAPYDQTHVINVNSIYELPFGKGKPFLNNSGGWDRVVGGFSLTSIIRWNTGSPISFLDARGTLNRVGRSASQTAVTSLNKDDLKNLIGVFQTPCGVFYVNPSAAGYNLSTCTSVSGGRGAPGFGLSPFTGEIFFNDAPGTTSGLERGFISGPGTFNWDASIIKNIPIKESLRLQLRVEAFNVLNHTNFGNPQFSINSTNFGRITTAGAPRILQLVGRIEF